MAHSLLERLKLATSDEERREICAIEARESRILILKERTYDLINNEQLLTTTVQHLTVNERQLLSHIDELKNRRHELEIEQMSLTIENIELEVKVFKLRRQNRELLNTTASHWCITDDF